MRAIYGQEFRTWAHIDERWATTNLDKIFGPKPFANNVTKAAWSAFLVYSQTSIRLFNILRQQYWGSLGALSQSEVTDGNYDDRKPYSQLADQVYLAYLWNIDWVTNPDGLLEQFLAASPDTLRGHLMWFAGSLIGDSSPPEWPSKAMSYAERRIAAARIGTTHTQYTSELGHFGSWYTGRRFDRLWALRTLRDAPEIAPKTDSAYLVFETMLADVVDFPDLVLKCVELIVSDSSNPWQIIGSDGAILSILKAGIASGGDHFAAIRRIASFMVARGYLAFANLDAS